MRCLRSFIPWWAVLCVLGAICAWAGPDDDAESASRGHDDCPHCRYAKRAFLPFDEKVADALEEMTRRRIEAAHDSTP